MNQIFEYDFFVDHFLLNHTKNNLKPIDATQTVPDRVYHAALKKLYEKLSFEGAGAPKNWSGKEQTLIVFGEIKINGSVGGHNFGLTAQVENSELNSEQYKAIYFWADTFFVNDTILSIASSECKSILRVLEFL